MEDLSRVYLDMYEGYEPMTPARQGRVDRQVQKAHKSENLAAGRGNEAETNKHLKRRIAMQDPRSRRQELLNKEEVDLYDLVLDYLLDEGFCDDEEAATVIMTHMSSEWRDCILEKADNTIRLVYGKGGKGVPFGNDGNVLRTPNVGFDKQGDNFRQATRDAARRFARKASKKIDSQDGVDARLTATQRKNISRLNAKPNVGTPEKDGQYHVDPEDKTSYYPQVPTDYRARKRRASGR